MNDPLQHRTNSLPELPESLVKPVDMAGSVMRQIMESRGVSPARIEARMQRREEARQLQAQERMIFAQHDIGLAAIASLANVDPVIVKRLSDKIDQCKIEPVADLLFKMLKEPSRISSYLPRFEQAIDLCEKSCAEVVAIPELEAILADGWSDEQINQALIKSGAKWEYSQFLADEEDLDDSAFEGLDHPNLDAEWVIPGFIDDAEEIRAMTENAQIPHLRRLLNHFRELEQLKVSGLQNRFVSDIQQEIDLAQGQPKDGTSGDSSKNLRQMQRILGNDYFLKIIAKKHVADLMEPLFNRILDTYKEIHRIGGSPLLTSFTPHASSPVQFNEALLTRIRALNQSQVPLKPALEIFRSTDDRYKLEVLEVLANSPQTLKLYSAIGQTMQRAAFASRILDLSRSRALGLKNELSYLDICLEVATPFFGTPVPLLLLNAPFRAWGDPRFLGALSGLVNHQHAAIIAPAIIKSYAQAEERKLGALQVISQATSQTSAKDISTALRVLDRIEDRLVPNTGDPTTLVRQLVGQSSTTNAPAKRQTTAEKNGNWQDALQLAIQQGKGLGVTSEQLSNCLTKLPAPLHSRIGYIWRHHPAALAPACKLIEEFGDKQLLRFALEDSGLCQSLCTLLSNGSGETLRHELADSSDSSNSYRHAQAWLRIESPLSQLNQYESQVTDEMALRVPIGQHSFRKVFFLGGQHSAEKQGKIREAAPEGVDVQFYHGIEGTRLDLRTLSNEVLVVCLTRSISHAIHDNVKSQCIKSGASFCYFTRSGYEGARDLLTDLFRNTSASVENA